MVINLESKVILVEFPWGRDKDPRVPLGHASLLAMLSKVRGVECTSIVSPINYDFNLTTIEREILNIEQNTICNTHLAIGVYVWCEDVVRELIYSLRKKGYSGQIILGGPQISYAQEGLESIYPEADVFIRGYGEFALAEIVKSGTKIMHKGVHYAGDSDLLEQTSVNLDLCPSPWLEGIIPLENQNFIRWETQRGCQFSCGFCQHKEAGAKLPKHNFNFNRIFDEIDLFCEYGVGDIAVLDPIFNSNPDSIQILKRFKQNNFQGKLSLQCRAELITDEFIDAASRLNVCLEFGLQTIHADEGNAVNRRNNMAKVSQAIDKVNLAGIEYEFSIIYGLPEQSIESFIQTVDWCLRKSAPVIKAFPLMLLRGTDTEKRKEEWGLVSSNDAMSVVTESNTFSFDDWQLMGRISQVLKETENKHPSRIEDILERADSTRIMMDRFTPPKVLFPPKISG